MPENEKENLRRDIFQLLKRSLRPEFLNRIDDIVMFNPLTRDQVKEIAKIQMKIIIAMLENHGFRLEVEEEVYGILAEKGYDPQSGARPVKRLIQKEIVNELSKEVISGKITKDTAITIYAEGGEIKFRS
jgi:ATP-dependent Clp protease ATP-binding subunit ClpB